MRFRLKGCATILALLVWNARCTAWVPSSDWFLHVKIPFPQFSKQPRCVRLGVGGCVSASLGFCLSLPRWCPSSVDMFICPKWILVLMHSSPQISPCLSPHCCPNHLVLLFLVFVTYDNHVMLYVGALPEGVFLQSSGCDYIGFYVWPSCETVGEETCAQNSRPGRALLKTALDCPDSPSS